MNEEKVCRVGIVRKVEGEKVRVWVQNAKGCEGCSLTKFCGATSGERMELEAIDKERTLREGDAVDLTSFQGGMGRVALLFFGIPCGVLMGGVFLLEKWSNFSTLCIGVGVLLCMIVYYLCLGLWYKLRPPRPILQAKKREVFNEEYNQ